MGRTLFAIYNATLIVMTAILNLYAIELNTICTNSSRNCTISTSQSEITNSTPFSTTTINIGDVQITNFINTSTITSNDNQTFRFGSKPNNLSRGAITHLINHGTIIGGIYIYAIDKSLGTITNYGEMRGVWASGPQAITINNQGTFKTNEGDYGNKAAHFFFVTAGQLSIENFTLKIIESQSEFNNFTGYTNKTNNKNSHLILGFGGVGGDVSFKDGNSKIIIDFDTTSGFELGKTYSIAKLVTNQNGGAISSLGLDFSRLMLKNRDFYTLTQSGDNFVVNLVGGGGGNGGGGSSGGFIINTEITELRKANLKTMNNLFVGSNAVIYSQKFGAKTANLTTNRITSINRTANRIAQPANRAMNRSANQSDKSHFTLMPFVLHNLYNKAGNYQLSGLDYGFIGAFSGDSRFGLHLGFSYGSLSDKNDKDFNLKTMNLMAGLNYKLDMIWDMYLKVRGDFFYFFNEISSQQLAKLKPDNLGFGANLALGKDFNMGNAGILGVEVGVDYKGLSTSNANAKSAFDNSALQDYSSAVYHLIYVDCGLRYDKYFSNAKLNIGAGVRKNLLPKLAKSKVIVSNNAINILLDNDNILGYTNAGISYVLNATSFSMELGIAYYGNFGDRSMSNGGSVEWRFVW